MTTVLRRAAAKKTTVKNSSDANRGQAIGLERSTNPVSSMLGKTLKAMRIARDLSQEQLAGLAEVDRTLISRIERGVSNPSLLTLSTICYVLDLTLSELLAPVKKNIKPRWADPKAPVRRQNQATGERRDKPSRRLR